jgi:hypothetical protein
VSAYSNYRRCGTVNGKQLQCPLNTIIITTTIILLNITTITTLLSTITTLLSTITTHHHTTTLHVAVAA